MIYGTFIEAEKELGKQLAFVSKVFVNDPAIPFYTNILIEKSEFNENDFKAVATDGRRLHIVDPLSCPSKIGIKEGQWRFLQIVPEPDCRDPIIPHGCRTWIAHIPKPLSSFVNYKKALPTAKPNFQQEFELGFTGKFEGGELARAICFANSFPDTTVIDLDFLLDLGNGFWTVSWFKNDRAVIFEKQNYKAVIMPLKI
jgi:hypothetical protein